MTDSLDDTRPLARTHNLVVEQLDEEILIYDMETDRAHCLNPTAALVWQHCDGQTPVDELGHLLEDQFSSPDGKKLAWMALQQLGKQRLLEEMPTLPVAAMVSRRTLVRSLGVAVAVLPLITSIVSPTAVEAATCLSSGQACTTSAECCSGLCVLPTPGTCA